MNEATERNSPLARAATERLLPSRAAALAGVRTALLGRAGPVLITGEGGAGKSWLARRLQAELSYPWRWAFVDVTPAMDPLELFRGIARAVGLPAPSPAGERWGFVDALAERAAEGERWVLVAEEVHNASDLVWEELRVLTNHLGEPGGFAGVVLLGQTPVARRLRTRPLAPFETRLAFRAHLKPLDLDETLLFLEFAAPGRSGTPRMRDEMHRDAAGNPRRLIQLASLLPEGMRVANRAEAAIPASHDSESASSRELEEAAQRPTPILVPAKPPLREEDGLIEVGWEPSTVESNDEATEPATGSRVLTGAEAGTAESSEEPIDDHYAALQAWTEWAQNQGRAAATVEDRTPATAVADGEPVAEAAERAPAAGHANFWAEGQHGFAPYSQLFSRLRQSRDSI